MAFRPSFVALARRSAPSRVSIIHKSMMQADTASTGNAEASSSRLLPHFKPPLPSRTPPAPQARAADAIDGLPQDGASRLLTSLAGAGSIPTKRKYYIVKPRSGDWPVYSRFRNDGACTTIIKGIKGDLEAFQRDVNEHFLTTHIDPLTRPSKATIRTNTFHVHMKGHVVTQVKEWMAGQRL